RRVSRQLGEKIRKARCVETEHRRKLPEEWTELVAQVEDARGVEVGERLVDFLQAPQVRDIARALDREHEVRGRLVVPGLVVLGPLQRVERAVDLDSGKAPRREFELPAVRQALGIEHAAPRLVAPARDADADHPKLIFFSETSFLALASCSSSVRSR